jgi:hypothetical protein
MPTPTPQGVPPPVLETEADCIEADLAMYRYKQPRPGNPLVDGYEADRQARALRLQINDKSERFQ